MWMTNPTSSSSKHVPQVFSGGSRGGTRPFWAPLLLDQTEARRAQKSFFGDRPPPLIWGSGWPLPPPPPPLSQSPVPALRYIKRYKQQQNMNWELWYNCKASKFSESTFANIRFSLLQVCPSAPSFVLSVLFIPLFHVLSGYFYVSLSLVALPTIWILINFVTQLL